MSGECDKCGEHALQCVCHVDSSIEMAANLIAMNADGIEVQLGLDAIKKSKLLHEFGDFYEKQENVNILEAMQEFAKLYPNIFHVPKKTESYGKVIIIT